MDTWCITEIASPRSATKALEPYARPMRNLRAEDPAEVVLAWEAVEELLAAIPESPAKDVLRMVAAGLPADEIAERLGLAVADVEVLAARGRIRVLTAAIVSRHDTPNAPMARASPLE